VYYAYGFFVSALTHEEFGRLVDSEGDKADEEHEESDTAHGD
jgi:hypothetical protein